MIATSSYDVVHIIMTFISRIHWLHANRYWMKPSFFYPDGKRPLFQRSEFAEIGKGFFQDFPISGFRCLISGKAGDEHPCGDAQDVLMPALPQDGRF
ncbi:hypothetical protein DT065_01815 [Salicibibacter kimchii]|uniref:Uncharacterized protein n=1 Tax=Salicibibacter kimchii TaxID=2099786 RepID=A0A345BV95_9BACI|nr:hypothetical protein DT065_01815 [Salicibibacter kimchii]